MVTSHLARTAGGLASTVPGLAAALRREVGCEAEIVGVRHPAYPDDWRAWEAGAPVHALRQFGPLAAGWAPAMGRTLDRLAPDLVHAQGLWMYPSLASRRRHARSGRPYLVAPHGMLDPWALRRSRAKKRIAGLWFEDAHLAGAACLHALTAGEVEGFRALGLRNPVCVVPNAVAAPPPPPPAGSEPPAWAAAVPEGARALLFLGRMHAKKGLDRLLLAWADAGADAAREGWCLVLAGWDEGGVGAGLGRAARELGIGRQVHLVGPQLGAAKDATLRRADAFVLPSLSEGLPVAVLEAWSYGLPVLMTPECNLPEGFAAGAAVHLDAEPRSIAAALRRLFATTAAEREAIGARGRALVADRFAWPAVARQMRGVYEWALGGGPAPSCVLTD